MSLDTALGWTQLFEDVEDELVGEVLQCDPFGGGHGPRWCGRGYSRRCSGHGIV